MHQASSSAAKEATSERPQKSSGSSVTHHTRETLMRVFPRAPVFLAGGAFVLHGIVSTRKNCNWSDVVVVVAPRRERDVGDTGVVSRSSRTASLDV